jgi:hypothetical protein
MDFFLKIFPIEKNCQKENQWLEYFEKALTVNKWYIHQRILGFQT